MSMSQFGITCLDFLEDVLASLDSPVKSEAIKLTENVVFIIIPHNIEILVVIDSKLSVVGLDLYPGHCTNFHLTSENLSRVYKQNS